MGKDIMSKIRAECPARFPGKVSVKPVRTTH
jgi:hypothetical protein